MIEVAALTGLADWLSKRKDIEKDVRSIVGAFPKSEPDLQLKTMDELTGPGYARRRVNYFVDDWTRVGAWVFIPEGREELPGILCCHSKVPQGKDEAIGVEGDPMLAFAQHYAQLGYVTIAPDVITAGERVSEKLEPYDTKRYYKENTKLSVMGKMVWDHRMAVSALSQINRVDAERIGVVGHGLGGQNAMLLAAFDERVTVGVASCAFTRFHDDADPGRWAQKEGFAQFPKLQSVIESRDFPFDWEHIMALSAPSALLYVTALNDERYSNTESCRTAFEAARKVYTTLGAGGAIEHLTHSDGHKVTTTTRDAMDEWFDRWL